LTRRRRPAVVYVGRAPTAALAFPCSSCYAEIGQPCNPEWLRGMPVPHQCRVDMAEAIGLVDVADAPLFDDAATRQLR